MKVAYVFLYGQQSCSKKSLKAEALLINSPHAFLLSWLGKSTAQTKVPKNGDKHRTCDFVF